MPRVSVPGITLFGWSVNMGDSPQDRQAVQFGIMLYDKYASGRSLTFPAFQMELSSALSHLATKSLDPRPVRDEIARDWPYWPGYFDPTK